MATHTLHTEKEIFYFITFTCYRWLPLLERTKIYDYMSCWFQKLRENGFTLNGYVIMPNHLHFITYALPNSKELNKTIGESKRFLAYEIVKRLNKAEESDLLRELSFGVQKNELSKGKKHQIFRLSFDAKPLDESEVDSVLGYIHQNPVSGVWNLVDDFIKYPYSSAAFYEEGKSCEYPLEDFRLMGSSQLSSESSSSDSEQKTSLNESKGTFKPLRSSTNA